MGGGLCFLAPAEGQGWGREAQQRAFQLSPMESKGCWFLVVKSRCELGWRLQSLPSLSLSSAPGAPDSREGGQRASGDESADS